jgi:hypothetical protein
MAASNYRLCEISQSVFRSKEAWDGIGGQMGDRFQSLAHCKNHHI